MSAALPQAPPAHAAPGERWALLLDVDGTLLDFALRPELVHVDAPLLNHLGVLQSALDGAVALVSGRRVTDLSRLFAPLAIERVGLHGLERGGADGAYRALWQEDRALTASLYAATADIAARLPGVHVEHKGPAVALHCRAAPRQMPAMRSAAAALAARLPGYALLEGYEVCELKPALADKGMAVRALLGAAPFAGRMPVYLGDDHTDAPALAAARELGGLAIAVGTRVAPVATHLLPCPAAVRGWLGALARYSTLQGDH